MENAEIFACRLEKEREKEMNLSTGLTLSQVVRYALDLYERVDDSEESLSVDEADKMVEALATTHGYTMQEVVAEIEKKADEVGRMGYALPDICGVCGGYVARMQPGGCIC